MKSVLLVLISCLAISVSAGPLQDCSAQFIAGDVNNAPTLFNSDVLQPFGNNKHLCYQDDGVSFFVSEYWPEEYAPRWVAYKLDPANYGINGCNTFTRKTNNCYIKAKTWDAAQACTKKSYQSDPFHSDHMLKDPKLGKNPFSNTGHDRGHMAPRSAFSWHVCGTYQTFSLANMSPQRAYLNQDIWRYLEEQVLTWDVDEGPIYVVTGVTYRKFPFYRFKVYNDGHLDPDQRYGNPQALFETVAQHKILFDTHPDKSDILHPKRKVDPAKVSDQVKNMRMPTGYYKVIYRPAREGIEAKAIGFLLPHTYENLNGLTEIYNMGNAKKNQDFWFFRARIDLIEEMAHVRFPGIASELKRGYVANDWWDQKRSGRSIRSASCERGTPQGILPNSSGAQRKAACTDKLVEVP